MAGAKEAATTLSNKTAQAKVDLPRIRDNAAFAVKATDDTLNASALDKVLGFKGAINPARVIPGTPEYDALQKIDQIKGKSFLEAFNSLRGGGQITEAEGSKATQAIARLSTAQSPQAFRQALMDLKAIVEQGYRRAQEQAGSKKAQAQSAPMPNESDPLGIL